MNQKSSLREVPQLVSWVLTGNNVRKVRHACPKERSVTSSLGSGARLRQPMGLWFSEGSEHLRASVGPSFERVLLFLRFTAADFKILGALRPLLLD